jgi:hypothetical protein
LHVSFPRPLNRFKKNILELIGAIKEIGQEISLEKTKYMLMSRHQNADENQEIKIANKSS